MSIESVPLIHHIPFGTTEPQDFELTGLPLTGGTGFTVALEIFHKVAGVMTAVTSPPTVAWLTQAAGTVRVTGAGGLAVANYYVRYKLTDSGGKIGYFPNGKKADIWVVAAIPGV